MASMMSQKPKVTDPLAAELFATMKGLQLAHDISITRLILEGDSANNDQYWRMISLVLVLQATNGL